MKSTSIIFSLLLTALLIGGCKTEKERSQWLDASSDPEIYRLAQHNLGDIILFDIFPPPIAARIYAYTSIAAYEALVPFNPGYQSLAGQLNGLEAVPQPKDTALLCPQVAAIAAFHTVEKALTFSEETLSSFDSTLQVRYRAMGIPEAVIKASVEYGESVGKHIVAWTSKDNYKQSRTFPRYTVTYQPGTWAPTPPAYADALEPHWNKIRPFTLDSAAQFKPVRPAPFDSTPGSEFMKLVTDVYETSQKLSAEQKAIAMFWDNNAFAPNVIGHLTFASKKVTPGGHWINIAMQVTRKEKSNLIQTAEAAALTAIAVQDGFISCWDEKYRSVYIRPETVINKYVDEVWRPFIQTPPFPEYTSGHSVISGAASVALSSLFGDTYAFVDSTEYDAGLTPRSFKSFGEAASEASVSRLYGGIHFRPALDIGSLQGNNVGQWVLSQVKTRK